MDRNITAHEPTSLLPCLCRVCLVAAPETASHEGMSFKRIEVRAATRVLHAWYPVELETDLPRVRAAMERRLARRYRSRYASPTANPQPSVFTRLRKFFGL